MTAATVTPYTGEAPRRTQPAEDFSNNTDDLITYLPGMIDELNEVSEFVNDKAEQAQTDAANSAISAATAQAASNYAGKWSTATGAGVEGESYNHDGATWQLLEYLADITTVEPSNAASEWQQITYVNFYDPNRTYGRDARVIDLVNGRPYISTGAGNLGNTPSDDTTGLHWIEDLPVLKWGDGRDYEVGEQARSRIDGRLYTSQQTPNVDNEPSVDDGSNWLSEYGRVSKPVISSPADEDTGVAIRPLLEGSAYVITGSDSPQEWANWQIATDDLFTNIVYDSGLVVGVDHKVANQLTALTTHYVRVAYKGVRTNVSEWSDVVEFNTTVALADYFNISLGTGNAIELETITGVDLSTNEGSLWILNRDYAVANPWAHRYETRSGLLVTQLIRDGAQTITDADALTSYNVDGHTVGSSEAVNGSGDLISSYTFRDRPGFHDTVEFDGNGGGGSFRDIAHNLQHEVGFYLCRGTLAQAGSSQENITRVNHKDWAFGSGKAFSNIASNTSNLERANDTTFGVDQYMNITGQTYVVELFAHNPEAGIYCLNWTGDGGNQKLTTGFPGGLILAIKASYTMIADIESGGATHMRMGSSGTTEESGGVTSFDSDGITVSGEMNTNGVQYYGVIIADPKQF